MANPADKNTYFSHMSEAFARHCIGKVEVMTRESTVDKIPQIGIWGQVEQPVLTDPNGDCTKVSAPRSPI